MYTLEEKIAAVSLVRGGMSYRQAAKACKISHTCIWNWRKTMDGEARGLYPFVGCTRGKDLDMDLDQLPDDPAELKRIIFDLRWEIDLRDAVYDILKKDPGVDPKTLPNREKSLLVDALAKKGTYSIGWTASSLRLAPATFYYHKKRIGLDPEKGLREKVVGICAIHPEFGYRRIKRLLRAEGGDLANVSEKRIRRIMGQEGLQPSRRRKGSRYSSYDPRKDQGAPLPNVPLGTDGTHDFSAPAPNRLWVSDVTEFPLPDASRVFLSPVLDCFDSSLVGWAISTSAKAEELTNPSLLQAAERLEEGDECVIHTDRGGQYFSEGWIDACERFGIRRSMSRKGHSPDNARMEGFFGRLKMEFFDTRDWRGVDAQKFMVELDQWLRYYNESREKRSLGWLSPLQYRERHARAA